MIMIIIIIDNNHNINRKSTCKGQGQAGESQSSECWLGSCGTERISFYQNFAIFEEKQVQILAIKMISIKRDVTLGFDSSKGSL